VCVKDEGIEIVCVKDEGIEIVCVKDEGIEIVCVKDEGIAYEAEEQSANVHTLCTPMHTNARMFTHAQTYA